MKMVVRSVNFTEGTAFDPVNPESEEIRFERPGKWGAPRLASYVRKRYGPTYAVKDIVYTSKTYGMPLDDFINAAQIVEE